ncbi:MAG: PhzF family phenazine biosynthesis protein [Candidatus Rokubacteria bacterium]|nr:PhzF family phenazine biosynthesis protein [Candidatus Rokubacteria bacterium]
MRQTVAVLQIDAFSSRPLGGNPAGVVLEADGLSERQMRGVAGELNVAETAFLTRAGQPGADHRLRWFTPSGKEVSFCGHATVATVHALAETGRLKRERVVFDTLGGLLPVTVDRTATGSLIWLEPVVPTCILYSEPLAPVLDALGLVTDALATWARPALTPERDLLLPAAGLGVLKSLAPDMQRLGRLGSDGGIRGFCLTSLETVEPASLIHSRFFAPHYGIPEDPVTGSVHASLPVWLWQASRLKPEGDVAAFTAEQGDFLDRPGRVRVELHLARGQPARVRVGGQAVTVLSGTIRVR